MDLAEASRDFGCLAGSCLCGSLRFEVRKPYLRFGHDIFWTSRAEWSCCGADAPRYDEYGPGWR